MGRLTPTPDRDEGGQGADDAMALLARLRYIVQDRDRHGNLRIYVRRHGRKVRLRATPGTKAFMAEYHAALAGQLPPAPRRREPDDGTLQHLIDSYMKSATWRALADRTRRNRSSILNRLAAEPFGDRVAGGLPVRDMMPRHVVQLRDRIADRPTAANGRVKVLRHMLSWGIENDLVTDNPAAKVAMLHVPGNGWNTWSLTDIARFAEHHADNPRAMLTLHLLLWTAVRRSDLIRLGRQHLTTISGRPYLSFVMYKGRARNPRRVEVPVNPGLKHAIDMWSDPHQMTFLTTPDGKPYTDGGIGNRIRKWCDAAGLHHLSAHGVRKGVGAVTAELGASEHQIMALLGHATPAQAATYTRAARRREMGTGIADTLDTKLSHLHPDAGKWDKKSI